MNRRQLHFTPSLDIERLQLAAGRHFGAAPVFIYFDAVDIWGSESRDPDPVQKEAFDAAAVRILIRRYQPNSGPIEGWLSVDLATHADFEESALAQALAAGTGVSFYYLDPIPDPDDEPGAEAAQMEVQPDGTTRHVWLSEFSDASGTRTIVSGRGEDEDDEE
jgi:hypothetical protein